MKLSELDREVTKLGYQTGVTAQNDEAIAISHDIDVADEFGEKSSIIDAGIDMNIVGNYMIEHRIPNKLANVIRKFANTQIDDRYTKEVAIVGRDIQTNMNGELYYTAYDTAGNAHDDATFGDLKAAPLYHLTQSDKKELTDRLCMQGMPRPVFVPVDKIDNRLKVTE